MFIHPTKCKLHLILLKREIRDTMEIDILFCRYDIYLQAVEHLFFSMSTRSFFVSELN